MPPSARLGLLYAFAGSCFSACFLIPWKLAAAHGAPHEATLALLASAAVFNSFTVALPIMRAPAAGQPTSLSLTLKLALAFAALSLAGNLLSAEAVLRISGALLTVMQRCEVLVVGLLGIVVLGERVGPSFWAGTALAGTGLYLLGQPSSAHAPAAGREQLIGALFGLGSAVCFGAMAVLTRKHIHAIQPVLLNALRLWFGVGLWFAFERRLPGLSGPLVLYAALAALFGPFLSRLAVMASARHVQASTTALAGLATPVITLLLGFALLGSVPTQIELLGGAVMLAGVALPLLAVRRSGA